MSSGDFLVFIGAFFWAGHVLLIGRLARRTDTLKLAAVQFSVCAALSMGFAIALETITAEGILAAAVPILYGGLISVGIAYTLQIAGQKRARPSHAAIILSLEAVFAALGGWLILGESLTPRSLAGAALMLAGMVISQVWLRTKGSAWKMHNI
jgi:drug/metabolite transporter (DMT)-like permease